LIATDLAPDRAQVLGGKARCMRPMSIAARAGIFLGDLKILIL